MCTLVHSGRYRAIPAKLYRQSFCIRDAQIKRCTGRGTCSMDNFHHVYVCGAAVALVSHGASPATVGAGATFSISPNLPLVPQSSATVARTIQKLKHQMATNERTNERDGSRQQT